ncbi:MAG: hypothetical protein AAB600_01745 [Patescibacteria group bacterium]
MYYWKAWKYKNLTFFIASVVSSFIVFRIEILRTLLLDLGNWGYLGAFIGGFLFVSSFTAAIGAVILLILAEKLSPLEIAIIAGLGGAVGDLTIFRFMKDNLLEELKPLWNRLGLSRVSNLLHTKYLRWTLPIIGAIIIVSPFPDEIGVALMGLSKIKKYQFVIIAFILDTIGVFLLTSTFLLFKS